MTRPHAAIACALTLLSVACPAPPDSSEPAVLHTVEVGGAIDEELDTTDDRVGYVSVESFGGVLPVDYPPDLPVYTPSSLIDFGSEDGRYVELTTPDPPDTVRERLSHQLEAAGWRSSGSAGSRWTVSKEERSALILITGDSSGSEIRIDYR